MFYSNHLVAKKRRRHQVYGSIVWANEWINLWFIYPLVLQHSYWTWRILDELPFILNIVFFFSHFKLPEGILDTNNPNVLFPVQGGGSRSFLGSPRVSPWSHLKSSEFMLNNLKIPISRPFWWPSWWAKRWTLFLGFLRRRFETDPCCNQSFSNCLQSAESLPKNVRCLRFSTAKQQVDS